MYYGIHYEYPFGGMKDRIEWIPKVEDFDRDLKLIKDTGFNSIRIRIGVDSNLDEVEMLLDAAQTNGLSVLFGFATFYVNDEFVEKYPDSKIVGRDGKKTPIDTNDLRWQRACIDHPVYRKERNDLMAACAKRFAKHPSIFLWCIHNEPSIGHVDSPCYCENTVAKYKKYLLDEYKSIEAINDAFNTMFATDAEIEPPKSRDENSAFWDNWRRYMVDSLSTFLNEGRDVIKPFIGNTPYTYNLCNEEVGITQTGQDWWNVYEDYPIKSSSMYMPHSEEALIISGYRTTMLKSFCKEGEDAFYTEFQGGLMYGLGMVYTKHRMEVALNSIMANGIKGVYIYRWEPLLCGPEPIVNGLIEADNPHNMRRLAMKEVLSDLRAYDDFIDKGRNLKPRVGIYSSREQVVKASLEGQPKKKYCQNSICGAFALYTHLGYETKYIVNGFTAETADCDLAVFPYMDDFDGDYKEIVKFIKNGGTAIVELPAFDKVETLSEIASNFGVEVSDQQTYLYLIEQCGWHLRRVGSNKNADGFAMGHRCALSGGETVWNYGDNNKTAALLPNGFDGRLLLTGFGVSYSYYHSYDFTARDLIGDFIFDKVQPDYTVTGVDHDLLSTLEIRVLEHDNRMLLFVLNRSTEPMNMTVTVRGETPVPVQVDAYSCKKVIIKGL